MVSVDTSHPNVRRALEDGLNMAEDMLCEKASFAIEVSGLDPRSPVHGALNLPSAPYIGVQPWRAPGFNPYRGRGWESAGTGQCSSRSKAEG